jgi:hypothetical protein
LLPDSGRIVAGFLQDCCMLLAGFLADSTAPFGGWPEPLRKQSPQCRPEGPVPVRKDQNQYISDTPAGAGASPEEPAEAANPRGLTKKFSSGKDTESIHFRYKAPRGGHLLLLLLLLFFPRSARPSQHRATPAGVSRPKPSQKLWIAGRFRQMIPFLFRQRCRRMPLGCARKFC